MVGNRSGVEGRSSAASAATFCSSHHQRAHGVKRPAEGVEYKAEDLEGDDAEERLRVARLAQDDRRVTVPLGKREVALRHGSTRAFPSALPTPRRQA